MFRKSQNTRKTLLLQYFIKWLWDSAIWSYHKVLWRFCFGHLICFLFSCLLIRFFMFFIVDTPGEKLTTKMLETKNVYILDCHSEIFVWYVKILSKILSLGFSFFLFFFFHSYLIPQHFIEIVFIIEQLKKRCEKLKICAVFLLKERF